MIVMYASALALSYMKRSGHRYVRLCKINTVWWNLELKPLNVCFKMSHFDSSDLFKVLISLNFFKGDKYRWEDTSCKDHLI